MRIVDRQTFLSLPAGTLYFKYAPHAFGDLGIKDATIYDADNQGIDWFYQSLDSIDDGADSTDRWEILHQAATTGSRFAMNFDIQDRDGLFDEDQLFAVFELPDTINLIKRILRCTEPSEEGGIDGQPG